MDKVYTMWNQIKSRRPVNRPLRIFWCGWAAHMGLSMAYQDWLGLDKYIAAISSSWIVLPWLVGALIAFGAMVYAAYNAHTQRF